MYEPIGGDGDEHAEPNTISYRICYSRDVAPYLYGNTDRHPDPHGDDDVRTDRGRAGERGMNKVVNITSRPKGATPFPVYKWRVNFVGAAPLYFDTLKEAKVCARQFGGVTKWTRSRDYFCICYTPAQEGG